MTIVFGEEKLDKTWAYSRQRRWESENKVVCLDDAYLIFSSTYCQVADRPGCFLLSAKVTLKNKTKRCIQSEQYRFFYMCCPKNNMYLTHFINGDGCAPCRAGEWSWGLAWHRWRPAPAAGCLLWCWTGTTLPPTGQKAQMHVSAARLTVDGQTRHKFAVWHLQLAEERVRNHLKIRIRFKYNKTAPALILRHESLNWIRIQRSPLRVWSLVETECWGRGEGGVEALIIVHVTKKEGPRFFKWLVSDALRCQQRTHGLQHPLATNPWYHTFSSHAHRLPSSPPTNLSH